jgi:hypothetical protein
MTILAQKLKNVAQPILSVTLLKFWGLDYRGSKREMQPVLNTRHSAVS